MIRTLPFHRGLIAVVLIVSSTLCVAQSQPQLPVLSQSDQGRLIQLDRWMEPFSENGFWSLFDKALKIVEKTFSLNPAPGRPTAKGNEFVPLMGSRPFLIVPILQTDTAFHKGQFGKGDWFARYIPQDGALLLRGEEKLSSWMRGLLFLTEVTRAQICAAGVLEFEEDFFLLDQAVMGKCFDLLSLSGGKPYLTLTTELRGEYIKKGLLFVGSLTQKQEDALTAIFGRPASEVERVLRSRLVRQQAHTWALQSVYTREKAFELSVENYPMRTAVKL